MRRVTLLDGDGVGRELAEIVIEVMYALPSPIAFECMVEQQGGAAQDGGGVDPTLSGGSATAREMVDELLHRL